MTSPMALRLSGASPLNCAIAFTLRQGYARDTTATRRCSVKWKTR